MLKLYFDLPIQEAKQLCIEFIKNLQDATIVVKSN